MTQNRKSQIPMITRSPSDWPYLQFDEDGTVTIAETRMRLTQLVQEKKTYGWSPEELHFQHPELSLAEVYSAFAYYYSNQKLVDRQIEEQQYEIERLRVELKVAGVGYDGSDFQAILTAKVELGVMAWP